MKIILIIIFSLLTSIKVFSQSPYIHNVQLIPSNPASPDSIFIISKVELNTQGYLLESNVNINGDIISVENCYRESFLFTSIYIIDTTYIGMHNEGNYMVLFTAYLSSASSPICDYTDTNQVILGLTVDLGEIDFGNKRKLIRQIDLTGRESKDLPNTILFRKYSDGTTDKVFIVE